MVPVCLVTVDHNPTYDFRRLEGFWQSWKGFLQRRDRLE
jgi:hypothetical protein